MYKILFLSVALEFRVIEAYSYSYYSFIYGTLNVPYTCSLSMLFECRVEDVKNTFAYSLSKSLNSELTRTEVWDTPSAAHLSMKL